MNTPSFRGRAVGVTHHFLPLLGGVYPSYLPPIYPLCTPLYYRFPPKSALLARRPRALPLRRTPAECPHRVTGGLPAVALRAPCGRPECAQGAPAERRLSPPLRGEPLRGSIPRGGRLIRLRRLVPTLSTALSKRCTKTALSLVLRHGNHPRIAYYTAI